MHAVWTKGKLAGRMLPLYENWPAAIFSLLVRRRREPFVVKLRRGVALSVHTRSLDANILDEVWSDKIYTPPRFAIRDGWVVVDVGGHKGIFSTFAATSAKNVRVYTYEASPETFAVLSENMERNHLTNVKVFNLAVSGKDGESVLHFYGDDGQDSLLQRANPHLRPKRETTVKTWSLAHLLREVHSTVNLLKIDIEGMEYEALFSCSAEDLQKVERIALEYHDDTVRVSSSVSELADFLQGKGFTTELVPGREILLAERTAASHAA